MWLSCVLSVGIVCHMCGCSQGVGISVAANVFALRGGLLHECAAQVSVGLFCLLSRSLLLYMQVFFVICAGVFCLGFSRVCCLGGLLLECAA